MIRTADDVNRMANLLALKIENRRPDIRKHTDYVRGKRGTLKFASDEFKRYMADRFSGFADNWCLPVAQAPVERIHFRGFIPYDDRELDSHVMRVWERNDCDRKLQETALMMTTTGRAFGLVTSMPDNRARISFEHPDSAAVHYDPLTGEVDAGLLVRYDEEHEFGTLLLPDMVFDVVRVRAGGDDERNRLPPGVDGWRFVPDSARVNPLGRVPLVEFRNQMLLDDLPISDVEQVESMQDAVNVCWAYTLNALDFASMPARVILGGDSLSEPVFDKVTGEQVGERPANLDKQVMERIMQITGDNVSIGEWTASNLQAFLPIIQKAVEHIAAETRTPGHYLLTNAEVPATGYEVAEAGLVSKTLERISFMRQPVRELCEMAMMLEDDEESARILDDSKVVFATPQYRSEALMADAMLKYKQLGYPLQWIAEQMGQSPEDIKRIMRMVDDESHDPEMAEIARSLKVGGASDDGDAGEPVGQPEHFGQTMPAGREGGGQGMEGRGPLRVRDSWNRTNVDFITLFAALQTRAASDAMDSSTLMLAEQGDYVRPDGGIANPLAFGAGFAPSGIDLESYFDIPVTHTLSAIKSGLDPIDAMRSGRRTLRQMAMQAIEDTSISAMGVSITQRSGVGYVRVELPDCCPRCAILAGKYFRHNNDFLRHPKCHGRTIPCKGKDKAEKQGWIDVIRWTASTA